MAGRSWRREDRRRSRHRPVPLCYTQASERCKGGHCIGRRPIGWMWSQRGEGGGAGGREGGAVSRCEGPAVAGRGAAVCELLRHVIPGPAA